MEAAVTTETSVKFYPATWHHILGDTKFCFRYSRQDSAAYKKKLIN